MEFTRSTQNKNKVLFEGHAYVKKDNLAGGWESFECERRRNHDGCPGKIKVKGDQVQVTKHHIHGPNPARNGVLKVSAAAKRRAQTTLDGTQAIIAGAVAGIAPAVAAQLPAIKSMRRNTQRQRKAANNNAVAVPQTRAALPNPVPQEFTTTNAGTPFLRWDSGDQDRILIFGSQEKLNALQNNAEWFMDGTFDCVPLIYGQLVTIHALVDGVCIPCIYAFLPDKTQATYTRLCQQLLNINGNLRPHTVLIDFEIAVKNALEAVFPGVIVKGCFFHLSQNIWRKVQANGLQGRYQTEPAFVEEVGKIAALAFVPEADVQRYFTDLSNNIDPDLDVVMDYFEEYYLGVFRRGRFRRPRFPYSWWGVLDRVQNNLPRTNNAVEGWHNGFNEHVGCHHANIWKLISVIKNDDDVSGVTLVKVLQGNPPKDPNPVYARINARIRTVVASYHNLASLEFLRGIAHNIKI